jgi:hypothetical protein
LIANRAQSSWLLVACAALLVRCAGNGAGLDQAGRPLPPGGMAGGALTADFDSIQQRVFTPICTVCHAGASAPQGLRLDAANSYALLVGVPSTEVPSLLRVKPGDPASSYIVQKLEGHAAIGAQMPFGGPPLPAATIAVIRQWISDGALRTAAAALAAAAARSFAVETAVPAPGDVLFAAPARLVIAFNQELDQTRIDTSSVHLERLARDTAAGALQRLPVVLSVPSGNPATLLIEPAAPLPDGRYRVVVSAAPETGVSSVGGARLGAGPSATGDGTVVTDFELVTEP